MAEISIVVPCYNTKEKYFRKCVKSIQQQTFSDFEVIVVDDGSTPNCADYLDKICRTDKRFKVYHQQNQGVSVARNNGVIYSTGNYIAFVDADDIVMPCFLEQAYSVAKKHDADVVYGFAKRTESEIEDVIHRGHLDAVVADNEWLKKYHLGYLYDDGYKIFGRGPYARIVKAEIAKAVLFPKGVPIGEDVLWNMELVSKTEKKILVDAIWYNYIKRSDSITCKYNPEIEKKLLPFYKVAVEYNKSNTDDRILFLNRVMRDLKRYIYDVYLGNKENEASLFKRWNTFNQTCRRFPWNLIGTQFLFVKGNKKTKIKWILFKTGVLFIFWEIKNNN